MELQVIGKLRLALSPFEPQWANVPLYLTARGLTTTPMEASGIIFEVQVDLIDHVVRIVTTDGAEERVALRARPVAAFYQDVVAALDRLGIRVKITTTPSEVADPIPFPEDSTHHSYDPKWATRFFQSLSSVDIVLKEHRARFWGKTSLVQFFWGTFDLALSRYSGRAVEPPPNAGLLRRVSGDAELICVGFWPGNPKFAAPAFFGYAYPAPAGITEQPVRPATARFDSQLGEFILPYDDVRRNASPRDAILEFCNSVYEAGSRLMGWDPHLLTSSAAGVALGR